MSRMYDEKINIYRNGFFMYLNEITQVKRGWLGKIPSRRSILKTDIAKLIANVKDEKLIETIRYLYKLNDTIVYSDLISISNEMFRLLEKHSDNLIKGVDLELTNEEVEKIEESRNLLKELISKYELKSE